MEKLSFKEIKTIKRDESEITFYKETNGSVNISKNNFFHHIFYCVYRNILNIFFFTCYVFSPGMMVKISYEVKSSMATHVITGVL